MTMPNTIKQRAPGRPKSLAKRQQILSCASELLLSLGYNNTSMDAVAKESGVSKQTVYSHFNNKDALFNAVIESKCEMYQVEEASVCIEDQPLLEILGSIGLSFIRLLNDDNVIAMYKVVIGESKQDSRVAQLFYDAGPLHSIKLVSKLLMNHPQSKLNAEQAYEASLDFFNLLKSDFHMRGILHLPYELTETKQQTLALSVANKTMAILSMIKSQ
ncbi:MAG: TetR/AcrR family transcriptional repressor of mexJK operon [Alphaproteobacteria bacterium]|jgi:TetR/AcrR family transcriptional repressor of mexJK operon